jgi:hypothetical protein
MKSPKNYQKGEIFMIGYLLGIISGFLLSWVVFKRSFKNGNFQINESDATKDVYTLFIDDFDKIHRRRYLLLKTTRK